MERHVTITFGIAGLPALHYRAEQDAAEVFVAEMHRRQPTRTVSVDDFVTTEMKPLPCQRLYRE